MIVLLLFTSLYLSQYYIPLDMPILYGVSMELMIILLCISVFFKTSYKKYIEKSLCFSIVIMTIINLCFFTWFEDESFLSWGIVVIETVSFISMLLYSIYRNNIESDEYNDKDTFIILKRPESFFDYFTSCVCSSTSSMSVVSKGKWYRFRKGFPFGKEEYKKDCGHIHIKINLKYRETNKILSKVVGTYWKKSQNCCHIVQKLFPDEKFSKLDSLPAYMAHKIIKIRG